MKFKELSVSTAYIDGYHKDAREQHKGHVNFTVTSGTGNYKHDAEVTLELTTDDLVVLAEKAVELVMARLALDTASITPAVIGKPKPPEEPEPAVTQELMEHVPPPPTYIPDF